jgi:NADH-quinone oxidoreductase subunit J
MVAENVAFAFIAAAMAFGAVMVVTTKNIVHAALFLVVVLGGAAAQYFLLTAEFVGWVQVIIYIGAIVVLFLFGIMLTRAPMRPSAEYDNDQRVPAAAVALLSLVGLDVLLGKAFGKVHLHFTHPTTSAAIGDSIFRNFVIPFEVVSMLLLAALVGAVVLARRD